MSVNETAIVRSRNYYSFSISYLENAGRIFFGINFKKITKIAVK